MVRGKRLTQRTGIELLHLVIGQVGKPVIAEIIGSTSLLQPLGMQRWIGDNHNLHFVHNRAKVLVEAGVQDLAKQFQVEAFVGSVIRDADPGDVALADMLHAAGAIHKVMDLSFEHRLEVLLHLPPCHLDDDVPGPWNLG